MNLRGSVYIITDENKILEECFWRNIQDSHLPAIQEFCDNYKLGYHFNIGQYQDAPCLLAVDGNMVVKTVEDAGIAIFYLPKYVTDRQSLWFFHHKNQFSNYAIVGGYSFDENTIEKYDMIHGIDEIDRFIQKKNIRYMNQKNNQSQGHNK